MTTVLGLPEPVSRRVQQLRIRVDTGAEVGVLVRRSAGQVLNLIPNGCACWRAC